MIMGGYEMTRTLVGLALLAASMPALAASQSLKCPLDAPYDLNNPFVPIVRGQETHGIIASDKLVVAFIPIGWENPGHALVIPRRAVRNLDDMSDREMVAVFRMIRRIAAAQRKALGATGYSVEQNNGRNQGVCHAHFHVIPNTLEQKVADATTVQRDEMAAKLRAALPAN
jgi:histidine triad (HIT) family protein